MAVGAAVTAAGVALGPWRSARGQGRPFRVGTLQSLSGVGAAVGKTALVGVQMAVDRINKSGGLDGRMVELIVANDESTPDIARRKLRQLIDDAKIDVHCGGSLSEVCLACLPVFEDARIVNMVGACPDTRLTTARCSRYTFRPFDYAPARARAFAPYLVEQLGKTWHIVHADDAAGTAARDAYAEQIKQAGGEIAGLTGVPRGTADMTPLLAKIGGDFAGLLTILAGKDAVSMANQAHALGLPGKYKWAGDGAITEAPGLPLLGAELDGFVGIDRYVPVFDPPLDTEAHKRFFDEAVARLRKIDPSGRLPDRHVQSSFEAINAVKLGIEKSGFQGRDDVDQLIATLEGLEMKEGGDFPQGDKTLRKDDHQAFPREFIFEIMDGKPHILKTIPAEHTIVPPACTFA